jgi:hypothetical protein
MKSLLLLSVMLCFQNVLAQNDFSTIGSGGGIAGTATVYKIYLDGKVLKGKGLGEITYSEQSKIGRSTIKKFFKKVKANVITIQNFNHPGNLYYFISLSDKGNVSKITWGDEEHAVPKEVETLYQEMILKLTSLKFVPIAQ